MTYNSYIIFIIYIISISALIIGCLAFTTEKESQSTMISPPPPNSPTYAPCDDCAQCYCRKTISPTVVKWVQGTCATYLLDKCGHCGKGLPHQSQSALQACWESCAIQQYTDDEKGLLDAGCRLRCDLVQTSDSPLNGIMHCVGLK
ncbi:hypothetical protein OAK19_00180 [Aureispira]|nr:hypothetical protein [Aureispira sp.]